MERFVQLRFKGSGREGRPVPVSPGDVLSGLAGSYRIEAQHGEGSFGVAFRAREVASGAKVIVKELRIEKLGEWKALELFEREARALAALSHPSIPSFRDFFAHDGVKAIPVSAMTSHEGPGLSVVLVLQLIEGETLEQRVERREPLPVTEAANLLRALLLALQYLHERTPPLVHRDIKPANVILTSQGHPYLADFGAIQDRLREAGSVGSTIVGTVGYMPLEQLRGDARPASDVYALGMTVVVALAGRPLSELAFEDATGKVSLRKALPPDTPVRVRDLLDAMVAPLLGQRIASATEALARLEGKSAPTSTPRVRLLALGGVVALLATAGAVFMARTQPSRAHEHEEVDVPVRRNAPPSPEAPAVSAEPAAPSLPTAPCVAGFPQGLFVDSSTAVASAPGVPPTSATVHADVRSLMDIDFGTRKPTKAGVAAVGASATDLWNPVGTNFKPDYLVRGLRWADGTSSDVRIRMQNFPGTWALPSHMNDPMYNDYSYSWSGAAATVTIADLPAGKYDFYIYTTIPQGNTGVRVSTCAAGTSYPLRWSDPKASATETTWHAGHEYVVEEGVPVQAVDLVTLSFVNGVQGTGNAGIVLNGMQIVRHPP